jgi:hypothetical protein
MSAAATAAGYLYASGRLRGRGAKEQEHEHEQPRHGPQPKKDKPRQEVRVAAYQPEEKPTLEEKPKRVPKIEYRTRRWKPE